MKSLLFALLFFTALPASALSQAVYDDLSADQTEAVYLVPIGPWGDRVSELSRYYRSVLHLDVRVLPALVPNTASWDAKRLQWSAESLIGELIEREERRLESDRVAVIAITDDDIFSKRDGWVFGWWTGARVAVVSTARMGPHLDQTDADEAILRTRLRHMVTRYIGRSYYGLPMVSEPTSPMFESVFSISALDTIGDDLASAGFFSVRPLVDAPGPIGLATGTYARHDVDFVLEDVPRVVFERSYRSDDPMSRPFGIGASHSYGQFLVGDEPVLSYVDLVLEDGARVHYRRTSPGSGEDAVFAQDGTPSRFLNSRLSKRSGDWLIELPDGSSYRFPPCTSAALKACTIAGYRDGSGREVRMTTDARGNLGQIETEHHHTIGLRYDDHDRVTFAWDDAGHWMSYRYDARGRLYKSEYSGGHVREYAYDGKGRMVVFSDGTISESMTYDAEGRCVKYDRRRIAYVDPAGHYLKRHETLTFAYTSDAEAAVRQVVVTGRDGRTRTVTFNAKGYPEVDTYAAGTPAEQRTAFIRDKSTNAIRNVMVSCSVEGHPATAAEELSHGQNETAVIARARRACDVKAAAAAR